MNAKVGDRILITKTKPGYKYFSVGDIGIVTSINQHYINVDFARNSKFFSNGQWSVPTDCPDIKYVILNDESN